MYKCFFALTVLASSTCYPHHGHGHGYYPSHPSYPSYRPSQEYWNYPSHSSYPHGASNQGNWNYHYNNGQDAIGWYNPSGNGPTGYDWQWPYKPRHSHSQTSHEETGFNSQATDVDREQSNTPLEPEKIDQDMNIPSQLSDSVSQPFDLNEQGFVDHHKISIPSGPEKTDQDGNTSSQTADQVNTSFDFDNQGEDHHQIEASSDPGKFGQDRDTPSPTADSVHEPIELSDQDSVSDGHQSGINFHPEITDQDGNTSSQTADQVNTSFDFDNQSEGHHQIEASSDPGKFGQDRNTPSPTADSVHEPIELSDQDSVSDGHQSGINFHPEITDQDGNTSSQTADQVNTSFDFDNQSEGHHQIEASSDPGKFGQDRNTPSPTADSVNKPIELSDQDFVSDGHQSGTTFDLKITGQDGNTAIETSDTVPTPFDVNNYDSVNSNPSVPSKPGDIPQGIHITSASDDAINQTANAALEANPISETNETLTEAYITGPDNTLEMASIQTGQANVSNNQSQKDQGVAPLTDRDTSVEGITGTSSSIGSKAVPALVQFLAPSLQWHVGIYTKKDTPYKQICGGSLVKTDVVISAAHCFWSDDEGAQLPALFAAAAGKFLRSWNTSFDRYAQNSDISEIHIPPRFQGAKTSFQDDIAIARLSTPFKFAPGVMPVCVDFDLALDRQHLQNGNEGTITGWGLTEPNGPPSDQLNFLKLPYVDIRVCISGVLPSFLKYITSDKICAGSWADGRALCRGDSGGGLVYTSNNTAYLRGIASTAPRDENECNAFTIATFTHLASHMAFLTDHVPDIGENCPTIEESTGERLVTETSDSITKDIVDFQSVSGNDEEQNVDSGDRQSKMAAQIEQKPNVTMESEERDSKVMPLPLTICKECAEHVKFECNCYCNKCK